jgi:hypothetical protein
VSVYKASCLFRAYFPRTFTQQLLAHAIQSSRSLILAHQQNSPQRVLGANTPPSTSSYIRSGSLASLQPSSQLLLAFNSTSICTQAVRHRHHVEQLCLWLHAHGMTSTRVRNSVRMTSLDSTSPLDNSWVDTLDPELRVPNQPLGPLSWQVQHQFQQQNQLQRFIQEPERTFFSAAPLQTQPQGFFDMTRPGAPISTLPRVSQNRMSSPSPSQGALTSTCSSALSPPAENDWSQDNIFSPRMRGEELLPMSQFGHSQQDFYFEQLQTHGSHVQLSQIQGFSDMPAEEVCYDGDEGYDEMALKTEYTTEIDSRIFKAEGGHSAYRYPSDEGLGASIKDEGSPQNSTIHVEHVEADDLSDADADADGDIDQDRRHWRRSAPRRRRRVHTQVNTHPQARSLQPKASPPSKRSRTSKPSPPKP